MNLGNKGYWNCLTRSHLFHFAFEVRVVDFCAPRSNGTLNEHFTYTSQSTPVWSFEEIL